MRRSRAAVSSVEAVLDETDGDGDDAGFSLVEMIVALFMITIGLLALVGQFAASIRAQHQQKLHASALRMATESVEQARQLPFSSLATLPSVTGTSVAHGTTYTEATSVRVCSPTDTGTACTPPAAGAPSAVRVEVDVSWRDGARSRHVRLGTSVADTQSKLLAASGDPTTLLGGSASGGTSVTLSQLTLSPSTVAVTSGGAAQSSVTASLSVTGLAAGSSFPISWADDVGGHQATMTSTGNGIWTATLPASSITRVVPAGQTQGSVVFAATVPGSATVPSATLRTVATPTFTGTCTVSPTPIVLKVLSQVTAVAETLSCTTSGLTSADTVQVSWLTATGSLQSALTSSTGTSWQVVLPVGTAMRLVSETFTFTFTRSSDSATGTQSVTTVVA
jgi:prepilin-type N-terminal cleavage/methylation domain-containing protein